VTAAYPQHAFEVLARAETSHFWFRARTELILWALDRYAPDAQEVLDVGCGTGFVLGAIGRHRPGLRLVGVELAERGLELAASRAPGAELLRLDARELPFEAEFDVVGAFDVLEHLGDEDAVLAAMARAVRPGGAVLVTVPQHPWLWSAVDVAAGHRRRYTRALLVQRLRNAGLEPVLVTSFVSLLLPALALSRRSRPNAEDELGLGRELRPGRLDALLGAVMAAEGRLIRRGTSLRAGGSLLAVARPAVA
jgi:SAM-dependent methyltransferase